MSKSIHVHRDSLVSPKTVANKGKVRPRKQFGQHFLKDTNILQKLVQAGNVNSGDVVLEIGPGLGDLTRALLRTGARVVAVEVDNDLADLLKSELGQEDRLSIQRGDFLSAPPEEWLKRAGYPDGTYKIVANLPYYITSAILRHLLEANTPPSRIVVTVQREVAQQITATPGKMSLLSVSVQFYGDPSIAAIIPAGAFHPRPQVDSAIMAIDVRTTPLYADIPRERFFGLVRAGFAGKRKQLQNSLAHGLGRTRPEVSSALIQVGVDPRRRAETLSLDEWARVFREINSVVPSIKTAGDHFKESAAGEH